MPYVDFKTRDRLLTSPALKPGELNYQLTMFVIRYCLTNGLSYQTINDVRGALDGAKLEFERRVAYPYEDRKIKENGDVYPSQLTGGD